MIKLLKPFKGATTLSITQGFHEEHKANDFAGKFGTFLVAPFNCKILSIIGIESDQDEPDVGSLRNGYGIRMQSVEDPSISCVYWHCQGVFPRKVGDYVQAGQVVAMMGNSGFVLSDGKYVEVDVRLVPPYKGTHLHYSMSQRTSDGVDNVIDPSRFIDWSIPIKYNILEVASLFLKSIFNYLKKGR